jgi:hypothetical protein
MLNYNYRLRREPYCNNSFELQIIKKINTENLKEDRLQRFTDVTIGKLRIINGILKIYFAIHVT